MVDYYCACTKTKCDGKCRKLHLFRERKHFKSLGWDEICPAAYKKDKRNGQR